MISFCCPMSPSFSRSALTCTGLLVEPPEGGDTLDSRLNSTDETLAESRQSLDPAV
jgi:hypothetical protein